LKRIALLSDTHGYIDDRIVEYLNTCDEIWHAGDIGNIELYDKLSKIKLVKAVFGNIDGHQLRSALPEIQRFFCEETDVMIKHIGGYPNHYDHSIADSIKSNPPNLFISGHSHILKVIFDKKHQLLHINPGAAGKNGFHEIRTMVRFSIDKKNITDLEVVELGARY
jgi:putative phosphoesterase